jgi:hypothetical protein
VSVAFPEATGRTWSRYWLAIKRKIIKEFNSILIQAAKSLMHVGFILAYPLYKQVSKPKCQRDRTTEPVILL